MLIKDVCKLCHVTKKALVYYEDKGLISPLIMENGYRDYSQKDIKIIKEICVLRHCGISVSDIKIILLDTNKKTVIKKYQKLNNLHIESYLKMNESLQRLTQNYDIEKEFNHLVEKNDCLLTVREKLILAFPGCYGLFLSLHFGRFLNESIDTKEKHKAYVQMIHYLDHLVISQELVDYMKSIFNDKYDIFALEQQIYLDTTNAFHDFENYFKEHQEQLENYIEYKLSDEYKDSLVKKVQEEILIFQKETGYQDNFIENLKILSSSYREYLHQLEKLKKQYIYISTSPRILIKCFKYIFLEKLSNNFHFLRKLRIM